MVELSRKATVAKGAERVKTYKMTRWNNYYTAHFVELLLLFNLHSVLDALQLLQITRECIVGVKASPAVSQWVKE